MAVPSPDQIREFYDRYFRTWNEHDREGFIENWKSFVTDVTAEDPIGTPLKRGFDEIVIGAWDLMNSSVSMYLEELIVCGNEAAMVVRNEFTLGDEHVTGRGIETMRSRTTAVCCCATGGRRRERCWRGTPQERDRRTSWRTNMASVALVVHVDDLAHSVAVEDLPVTDERSTAPATSGSMSTSSDMDRQQPCGRCFGAIGTRSTALRTF